MKRFIAMLTTGLLLLGATPVFANDTGSLEGSGELMRERMKVMYHTHKQLREKRVELRKTDVHGLYMVHARVKSVDLAAKTVTLQRGDSERTLTVQAGTASVHTVKLVDGKIVVAAATLADLAVGQPAKLLVTRDREAGTVTAHVIVQFFRPEKPEPPAAPGSDDDDDEDEDDDD